MKHTPAKILMVIAQNGFRDEEYFEPKKIFEENNLEVITASSEKGKCKGKLGGKADATISLRETESKDYDAIVFVCGPGAEEYFQNDQALKLAREFAQTGKITAAICIAPVILANAGILAGKKATVYESGVEQITAQGAKYTKKDVEIDDNIITACGPAAAKSFGQTIVSALK